MEKIKKFLKWLFLGPAPTNPVIHVWYDVKPATFTDVLQNAVQLGDTLFKFDFDKQADYVDIQAIVGEFPHIETNEYGVFNVPYGQVWENCKKIGERGYTLFKFSFTVAGANIRAAYGDFPPRM